MDKNKISFWDYLKQHVVTIPIIQRDYAQGRPDKVSLRKIFLASLKHALDGTLENGRTELKLDFVYGSLEGDILFPLDGQQRLTTLWLLHWYIALRAGKLNEAGNILSKFSYETRRSSREFCKQLCLSDNFKNVRETDNLKNFIISRTWFPSYWLNDPTIASMLRMISGTAIDISALNKKNKQHAEDANRQIDGLEKLFRETSDPEFERYWTILTSDNPPFFFYQLPLHEFGLTDDLYVKMNARGKQLTPYENFKADLIGYIRQRAKDQKEGVRSDKPDSDKDWDKLLDPRNGIAIKLDTDWTNVFWEFRSEENSVDEIFFSFINRVFLEEMLTSRKSLNSMEENEESGARKLEELHSFRHLISDEVNEYHDLTPYRFYMGEIPYSLFQHLDLVIERYMEVRSLPDMLRDIGEPFYFIPRYVKEEKKKGHVTKLTQQHRVVFHAVYKYLLEGSFEEISFKRWLRVVCNMTSGKSLGQDWNQYIIRTTGTMLAAIDALSMLDSHLAYESLRGINPHLSEKEIPNRLWEEAVKASQIIDESNVLRKYPNEEFRTWEEAIAAAENHSFFNGSIRFLFQNQDGIIDWTDFESKFGRTKSFFAQDVHEPNHVLAEEYYKNDASLLQSLISKFTPNQFWHVIWWQKHFIFDNSEMTWRHYLYHKELHGPIHSLLTSDPNVEIRKDSTDRASHMLYLLSNTGLLDFALHKFTNSYIRTYHGHDAIYPSSTGVFLDTTFRDSFLRNPEIRVLEETGKVPYSSLLYGTDIDFNYKGNNYRWYRNGLIYLMRPDQSREYQTVMLNDKVEYFSIESNCMQQENELLEELVKLPLKFKQLSGDIENQPDNSTE